MAEYARASCLPTALTSSDLSIGTVFLQIKGTARYQAYKRTIRRVTLDASRLHLKRKTHARRQSELIPGIANASSMAMLASAVGCPSLLVL